MKKIFMLMTTLLLAIFIFTGCIRSYTLFYDFDELTQNLEKVEIIYMEDEVIFFDTHWYVGVDEIDYEVVRELSYDETYKLLRGLSNVDFRYTVWFVPASVSAMYFMQGYAIKLHYRNDAFMIVAQTGDFRYEMPRFGQARAGRRASGEDWNTLMSELYFGGRWWRR